MQSIGLGILYYVATQEGVLGDSCGNTGYLHSVAGHGTGRDNMAEVQCSEFRRP